tara:strand:- start:981 stop:1256 length:276 start_codon:yes stop_codon:yes gene_type:complete
MEQKMKDGELNEETLKKEAQSMYGDMANNPLFGNLMKQMNPDSPVPESTGLSESTSPSVSSESKDTKELSKEEKKEKLKKKIEAKKKERTK